MTPDEIEKDRAPERIWIDAERTYSATSFSAGIKYIRADLHDAEVQRLTRERDAANSRAKGNWKHLSRLWDLAKGYDPDDDEEGPRCRDCADENGRCPHSGFPCDPQEEAEERIRKMFAASSTEPAAPSVSAAAKVLLGVWPTDASFDAAFNACAANYHGGDQMQDVLDRTRETVSAALRALGEIK